MDTDELVKSTADAESYTEFRKIREGEKVAATVQSQVEEEPEQKPSESEKDESAAAAEAPEKDTQEQPKENEKPKRDRSAEGRISELTSHKKRVESENEELRKKLAEFQASKPAAETPPEPVKPAAQPSVAQPSAADPEPKPEAFDTYEQYVRAAARWEARQERVEQEAERERGQLRDAFNAKAAAARARYADFDSVTAGDRHRGTGLILTPAMQQYVLEEEDGLDAAYLLGQRPHEAQRIRALTPTRQLIEMGRLVSPGSAPTPEKPKTPVSKVPAPPRVVGGTEPPSGKSPAEAKDYAEYKRLREKRS